MIEKRDLSFEIVLEYCCVPKIFWTLC